MIDECLLSLIYAAWLAASTMPLGLMLGSSCSPCCGCGVADGKERTDPKDEGTWVPSGTWRGVGGVTWSFTANPGDESGEMWFFYGSSSTSKVGGNASTAEQQDWGNLCNWYSNKLSSPSVTFFSSAEMTKRATRLPPETAVVHVYTSVSTVATGPQTVKAIYFWGLGDLLVNSEITTTASAHDSVAGAVFNSLNSGTVNNGATFIGPSNNTASGVINDGATFNDNTFNGGTVNGGATFNGSFCSNSGTVNGGATFNDFTQCFSPGVNGGATFNGNSSHVSGVINGGATFNDNSRYGFGGSFGNVNDGATFNDAACSTRVVGTSGPPCTRKFVAHPTDLPTCNGTAPNGCFTPAATCGCG